MIDILIGDDYKITSDTMNYKLQKKMIAQSGKSIGEERWETVTYHGTVVSALHSYKERKLKDSDATSMASFLHELELIKSEINKVLEGE